MNVRGEESSRAGFRRNHAAIEQRVGAAHREAAALHRILEHDTAIERVAQWRGQRRRHLGVLVRQAESVRREVNDLRRLTPAEFRRERPDADQRLNLEERSDVRAFNARLGQLLKTRGAAQRSRQQTLRAISRHPAADKGFWQIEVRTG